MSLRRGLTAMAAVVAMVMPLLATTGQAQAQADNDPAGWHEAPGVIAIGTQDRVYGKPDARFSLIVWLDPECPYCKEFGAQPQHVVDGMGGRVNLAVRLYPLSFHGPNAVLASKTALCVADQAGAAGYYRFLDDWLAKTGSSGRGIPVDAGAGSAASAGGDASDPVDVMSAAAGARNRDALAGCTTSDRTSQRLAGEMQAGDLAGIEGTPAVALRDNRMGRTIMVSGAISQEDMRNAIQLLGQMDDRARRAPATGQGVAGGTTH